MDNDTFPPPTWPAPRVPAPPTRRWTPPQLSAAGWLATAGASLLLVASIIVVAGNWQSIDPAIRFAGLVASLVAVYFAAEAGRRRLPSTSRALATLAAALTAPAGIAAAATLGQPWPVCTLVGGVAALVATEIQSHRWHVPALRAASVVAFGLAAVGTSALTSIPATLIVAAGSVVGLVLGSVRRTLALAVAVGVAPVVVAVADAGYGPGTLARLGMTGSDLAWAAPLSCTVAAAVIAVIAQRRANMPLAVAAIATFASGVLTWLVADDAGAYVWWSIPALALLVVETVGATRSDTIWRALSRRTAPPIAIAVGACALAVPGVTLAWRWLFEVDGSDLAAAAPAIIAALALVASSLGSARRAAGDNWATAALVAATGAAFGALIAGGSPLWIASLLVIVSWGVVTVATPWRSWDLTTATLGSWILLTELLDTSSPSEVRVLLVLAVGVAVCVSTSIVRRNDEGFRLVGAAAVVATVAAGIADQGAGFGTFVFAALIALGVSLAADRSTWPLVAVTSIGLATLDDAPTSWWTVAMVGTIAVAYAGSSRSAASMRSHAAAGLGVFTAGLALAAAGIDPGTATMAGVVVGTALSGIALLDRRFMPALTAGLTATAMAFHASTFASPVFVSIAVTMLGIQMALAGGLWRGKVAAVPGAVIGVGGLLSSWWTTGTNSWVIDAIEPSGATGVDVVVGVLVILLLLGGALLRRNQPVGSWLAYGPGLAFAGTWLLASQLEVGADWATFGGLAVGVTALGVGGWRRLGAPLVVGTIMVGGTILISAGPRLAATPTWIWIAVGGVGLLVVAALIERSDRPIIGRADESTPSIVEGFCKQFR